MLFLSVLVFCIAMIIVTVVRSSIALDGITNGDMYKHVVVSLLIFVVTVICVYHILI